MPPKYVISRVADPIFAIFIGLGAAATRINREEKEKGRTAAESFEVLKRRIRYTINPPEASTQ